MFKINKIILLIYWVSLSCFSLACLAEDVQINNELAVLIDVSGSMKQNDPHNLRVAALKLLINVLPANVRAGIWLFDEKTTPLVPMNPVDAQWKQQALQTVEKVHSAGLFTDIEQVITVASDQWTTQTPKVPQISRNVLLLTDGMVDISKDAQQNTLSRQRILSELLPRLQQAKVHLQTIALSKHADAQLLKKLALATDGWNKTVVSDQQLERVFWTMFQESVPQTTVPLSQDNKFIIDNSIKEFSALIFKNPKSKTELLTPTQQLLSETTQLNTVQWVSEKNYDLMTINEPEIGDWQIKAGSDPDNRVMIVTDLKFELDALPKYQMTTTPIKFRAHFTDKGELLTREDFLNLIEVTIRISDGEHEYPDLNMVADAKHKGYFDAVLDKPLPKGSYLLTIVADGKTFTREINLRLEMLDTPITLTTALDAEKKQVKLILTPDLSQIKADSVSIEAQLTQIGQESKTVNIPKQGDQWELAVDAPSQEAPLVVNFVAKAKTNADEEIVPEIKPFMVEAQLFEAEKVEPPEHPVEEAEKTPEVQPEAEVPAENEESHGLTLSQSVIVIVAVNILLLIASYFIYRYFKNKELTKETELLDKLS